MAGGGNAINELPLEVNDRFQNLAKMAGMRHPLDETTNWADLASVNSANPLLESETLVDDLGHIVSSFTPLYPPDPSFVLGDLRTRLDAAEDIVTRRLTDALWGNSVSTVLSRAASEGHSFFSPTYVAPATVTNAAEIIALAAVTHALSATIPDTSLIVDNALQRATTNTPPTVTSADSLVKSLLGSEMVEAHGHASGITYTQLGLILSRARDYATTALGAGHDALETATIVNDAITTLLVSCSSILSEAVSSSLAMIADGVLQPAVDEYENRITYAHMRSVNRLTGPLSDINAVVSSQFAMAMANLENELQIDVRKYDADLSMQLFQTAIPIFAETLNRTLGVYLQTYMQELGEYLRTYQHSGNSQLQAFLTILPQYFQAYLGLVPQYLGEHQSIERGYEGTAAGVFSGTLQSFGDSLNNYLQSATSLALERNQARDQFALSGVSQNLDFAYRCTDLVKNNALLFHNYAQLRIAADNDYSREQLIRRIQKARWGVDLLQVGANILAAPSGAAVMPQTNISPGQRVAAGAFVGAAIGTPMAPPYGALVGAGIGAVLGGISQ